MLIKSIELNNFRQFRGTSRIDFSTDKSHSVSIILGQNTSGKTTLVRAFAWCLYGGTAEELGFKKSSSLLNEDEAVSLIHSNSRYSPTREVRVALEVETQNGLDKNGHRINESVVYRIIRSRTYEQLEKEKKIAARQDSIVIYKRIGHKNEEEIKGTKRIREIINSIMPKDLSEYFFYWGEKIENIKKKDLDKAVTEFTGIDEFTNAIVHLNQAIRRYDYQRINASQSVDVHRLTLEREEAERTIKDLAEKIVQIEENIAKLEEEVEKLGEARYKLKNDEELLKQKDSLEAKKARTLNMIDSKIAELITTFNSPSIPKCMVQTKAEKLLKEVDSHQSSEQGWANITVDGIQEILKKGICICGTPLKDHPDLKKHLIEEMKCAVPNSLSGVVSRAEGICDESKSVIPAFWNSIFRTCQDIKQLRDNLSDIETDLNSLARIRTSKEELIALENKSREVQRTLRSEADKRAKYNERKEQAEKRKNALSADIDNYFKTIELNQLIEARLALAKAVREVFVQEKREQEEVVRKLLQQYTQEYLNEMYHGERTIEVNEHFNIKVINEVNGLRRENDTSPGFETVKNFAFVCALITIAKDVAEQRKAKDANAEDVSEPYPLVLDAPFSQTDRYHVLKICSLVSRIAEQTILVMMEKDWEVAKEVLGDQIGKQYLLVKKSETISKIEVYQNDAD